MFYTTRRDFFFPYFVKYLVSHLSLLIDFTIKVLETVIFKKIKNEQLDMPFGFAVVKIRPYTVTLFTRTYMPNSLNTINSFTWRAKCMTSITSSHKSY